MPADIANILDAQQKAGVLPRQAADILALYRSCVRNRHPGSQEMARRYEQELRQLVGNMAMANG
jgi:hypothetical protein